VNLVEFCLRRKFFFYSFYSSSTLDVVTGLFLNVFFKIESAIVFLWSTSSLLIKAESSPTST